MRRVVITGTGLVSPIGNTVAQSWQSLKQNKSGIESYLADPILKNDNIPYNLALIKNFNYASWKVPHANSRMNNFAHAAMHEAINSSTLQLDKQDKQRIGICLGVMSSNVTKMQQYIRESVQDNYRSINRLSMLQILSNIVVGSLNVKYQLLGPSLTVSTACASGLSAIQQAYKWIKLGQTDISFAGGTQDVYNPVCLNSSLRLQAMSNKVYQTPGQSSRPFDKDRSGFILGQGAGILVLQQLQHALNRKANIICEILGYGCTSDGYHLVRPKQSGQSQTRAMQLAIKSANLSLQQIDLVNVHATSTKAGDQIEARSIDRVFGRHKPYISAYKSTVGHTFGAAGAIETILGLQSMKQSLLPKILNLQQPDIKQLNYIYSNKQNTAIKHFMKNSFGFGGINVSMIFRNYEA